MVLISCYADDNTYKAFDNHDAVLKTLRMSAEKLFKWFKGKLMKGNIDKCTNMEIHRRFNKLKKAS